MIPTSSSLISSLCLCGILTGATQAQPDDGRRGTPPRGDSQAVTQKQKAATLNAISKYDAASLSADDAKSIHRAIRDIGIQSGPAEDEVISSAGFYSEAIKHFDPPPGRDRQASVAAGPARTAAATTWSRLCPIKRNRTLMDR